jgi:hypothetical protein
MMGLRGFHRFVMLVCRPIIFHRRFHGLHRKKIAPVNLSPHYSKGFPTGTLGIGMIAYSLNHCDQ